MQFSDGKGIFQECRSQVLLYPHVRITDDSFLIEIDVASVVRAEFASERHLSFPQRMRQYQSGCQQMAFYGIVIRYRPLRVRTCDLRPVFKSPLILKRSAPITVHIEINIESLYPTGVIGIETVAVIAEPAVYAEVRQFRQTPVE